LFLSRPVGCIGDTNDNARSVGTVVDVAPFRFVLAGPPTGSNPRASRR
jgi:hypothetical protein